MNDDLVARYVQHVLGILHDKQATTEQIAQLDKLSETLGLTEYDLAYLDKQFVDAQKRGASYLRYKQWDKAIGELEQAILLKPLHTNGLYQIADAFRARYRQRKSEKDRQKALYYAERCLQTDADCEKAIALVSQLQNPLLLWRSWLYRHWVVGLILACLLLCGLTVWFMTPTQVQVVQQAYLYAQRQDIRLELDEKLTQIGVKIDKNASFARQEGTNIAYQLRGYLYHPTAEITHLEVTVKVFDGAGELLQSQNLTLWEEKSFELRPNDYLPIHALLQIANPVIQISKAVISAVKINHNTPDTYEKNQIIALKTDSYTSKLGLQIVERYQTIKPEADSFAHTICLAYQHAHTKPLRLWRIEIQWTDRQERLIHSETATLISPEEPFLKAEKWRNKTFSYNIPFKQKDFSRCQVLVLSAE